MRVVHVCMHPPQAHQLTGGAQVLRIWKVRDSLRDLRLLEPAPACTFVGHQGDILDIAWSRAQFILTSSMDKTVRLWHITREDCLYVFNVRSGHLATPLTLLTQHEDFVTSVAFHPTNDRLFLSGCLDKKLRLWSIPDKAVVEWKDVGGFVTAATFTPNVCTLHSHSEIGAARSLTPSTHTGPHCDRRHI